MIHLNGNYDPTVGDVTEFKDCLYWLEIMFFKENYLADKFIEREKDVVQTVVTTSKQIIDNRRGRKLNLNTDKLYKIDDNGYKHVYFKIKD